MMKETPRESSMYTVFMVNFGMTKGTFAHLEDAIVFAKGLGFECAIYKSDEHPWQYIRAVKPY